MEVMGSRDPELGQQQRTRGAWPLSTVCENGQGGGGVELKRWQRGGPTLPEARTGEQPGTGLHSPLPPSGPVTKGTGHVAGRRAPALAEGGGGAVTRLEGGPAARAAFLPSGLGTRR